MSKNLIIASTSTVHGSGYLAYILPELEALFKGAKKILFIPYARPSGISHDAYTAIAAQGLKTLGKTVEGIHNYSNPAEALENAEAIFTGGGNTFVLVSQLYKNEVMAPLRKILLEGTPYLGTSAGSNICGLTMQTTNDMPIAYPPSFKTLGLIPYNLNPHYLDPIEGSTHKGETRETRIKEYHAYHNVPVLGLREGSWLRVQEDDIYLRGDLTARVFEKEKDPYEIKNGTLLDF